MNLVFILVNACAGCYPGVPAGVRHTFYAVSCCWVTSSCTPVCTCASHPTAGDQNESTHGSGLLVSCVTVVKSFCGLSELYVVPVDSM